MPQAEDGLVSARRIILITPYFHPEVISCVPLMASLAEDLAAAGYDVTVLTAAPVQWDNGEVTFRLEATR